MLADPALIAAAGIAAVAALCLVAGCWLVWRRQRVLQTVRLIEGAGRWSAGGATSDSPTERSVIERLNTRLLQGNAGKALQHRLDRAGLARLGPARLLVGAVASAALGMALGAIVAPPNGEARAAAAFLCGVIGAAVPSIALRLAEARRSAAFERRLPDAADAMAAALRAGASLPQAMRTIQREMGGPVADEFGRVVREMSLGLSLTEALTQLQGRLASPDVRLLTSAIGMQQRLGGDLADVLSGLADTIRERLRIRSEVVALTAQGRYSAYLITALPALLFVLLWLTNYDYLAVLFEPGMPRLMAVGAVIGVVLGYMSLQRIVRVEV